MLQHPVVFQEGWLAAHQDKGGDKLIGTLMIRDRTPKSRNKKKAMNLFRRHDEHRDRASFVRL
jgi:predicted dithiol-disulfide oxidoreductase (DUF899 family)